MMLRWFTRRFGRQTYLQSTGSLVVFLAPFLLFRLCLNGNRSYYQYGNNEASVRAEFLQVTGRDYSEFFTSPDFAHPYNNHILNAEKDFRDLLAKQTVDYSSTLLEYKERRGRSPPPGFDAWFRFARDTNSVIIEPFFDQIYEDLEPFWALSPGQIQEDVNLLSSARTRPFIYTISIRSGRAGWAQRDINGWEDEMRETSRCTMLLEMVVSIASLLPDLDIPCNAALASVIFVPFHKTKPLKAAKTAKNAIVGAEGKSTRREWRDRHTTAGEPEVLHPRRAYPAYSAKLLRTSKLIPERIRNTCPNNLVQDHKTALDSPLAPESDSCLTDLCQNQDIMFYHGNLIEPIGRVSTTELVPIFSSAKLTPVCADILFPDPVYWKDPAGQYSLPSDPLLPWSEKLDVAHWKGSSTGGNHHAGNWKGFHRHRFVEMTNCTQILSVGSGALKPVSWNASDLILPPSLACSYVDVGFTNLTCPGWTSNKTRIDCSYMESKFSSVAPTARLETFKYKYLPDIDGNGFSGRFRALLLSNSLPIKATIWREWHDKRLIPWKHFVPMNNKFTDFWKILEFFLGRGDGISRDPLAQKIAVEGGEWARQVLRVEDMQVYLVRLLLEYKRLAERHV